MPALPDSWQMFWFSWNCISWWKSAELKNFQPTLELYIKEKTTEAVIFKALVEMKSIWILLKLTMIWVHAPRGSFENPERVSQAQYALTAYYLLKIKSVWGTCLEKLGALYSVFNF